MRRTLETTQRLWAIFLLGAMLFNYPLLSLFNLPEAPGGFPLLFVYIFGTWALVIALAALVIERRRKSMAAAFQRHDE